VTGRNKLYKNYVENFQLMSRRCICLGGLRHTKTSLGLNRMQYDIVDVAVCSQEISISELPSNYGVLIPAESAASGFDSCTGK